MQYGKNLSSHSSIQEKELKAEGLSFGYEIAFEAKRNALLIQVFHGEKIVTRFEKFGIHVLSLHDRYLSGSPLDPTHRHFIQHLLRFAHLDSWENFYVLPKKHTAYFLQKLSKFGEVRFLTHRKAVPFSKKFLSPIARLKGESFSRLSLQLEFQMESAGESFPFSQTVIFGGNRPWALIRGTFYPIKNSKLDPFLEEFDEEGNLTFTGTAALDFLENHLPVLLKREELLPRPDFIAPQVIRPLPKMQCTLSENDKEEKLFLDLHFSYGGVLLAPFEKESDLLVEVNESEKRLLICRDLAFEKETLEKFISQGFHRVGLHRFETGGEAALDFLSEKLADLKNEGDIEGEQSLRRFRVFQQLGRGQLKAKAHSQGLDWFALDLKFQLEEKEIPFEIIRTFVKEGKRYLPLPGKGFVKIQREEILALEETFSELEGHWKGEDLLELKHYHAPYLESLLSIDWKDQENLGLAIRSLQELNRIPSKGVPAELESILRPYQHHGYDWLHFLHDHHFHGILADDMGLGKTLQALAFLLDLKNKKGLKPALVLAPTSVVFNWAAEAQKFTPQLKTLLLTGAQRKESYEKIDETDLTLTSYAIFRRDAERLSKRDWRCVILDEAQYIKNYRSKTAGLVKELKAEQRLALTGTPLENRLSELWSIYDFLMPGFLGNFSQFQRRYQKPIEEGQNQEALGRLKKRIFPFLMRRQKEEVAPELPPKTEIDQYCEMIPEQRRLYEEILVGCRRLVFQEVEQKGLEKSQISILTALLRLRQVCCHPHLLGEKLKGKEIESGKMEMFEELLEEIISEGHRVIVFSQFVEMLTLLRKRLEANQIVYEYLDGRTRRREEKIRRFQESKDIPVFLISLKAGGTGVNLSEADYVIHYDPWWNPAVQDQATDRVHRIGQKQHVFSYKLITKESVEEKIMTLQQRKKDLFKGVLTADSSLGKKLSFEDLEYLFSL